MKAIIPVAGKGTRLYPLTITTPKPLIKILNKPVVQWNIEHLLQNNINEIVLIISNDDFGKKIQDFVMQKNFPAKIEFVVQDELLGTANAVKVTENLFQNETRFLYLNGDDIYSPEDIALVLAEDQAVIAHEVEDPEKWGIFKISEAGNIADFIEKPTEDIGNLASIHCMKLSTAIFQLYSQISKSSRGEYELTELIKLLAITDSIKVLNSQNYWLPVGYPWQILDAHDLLIKDFDYKREGTIEENVTIHGNVHIPKSSIIKAGTYIEGNIILGENCIIGPQAYLRQNVVIDDNSHIGAFVEVKNSVIGSGSKIPHISNIGDSIIGNNVNISAQNSIANLRHDGTNVKTMIKEELVDTGRRKFGTVIGDNVKTGIGTRILPGRKIWPNMTTNPGDLVNYDVKD